ncbi:hypothetical protein Pth03_38150 [Planotetraspora thailandica]|uniref:DUF3043 domain-containing protein n=1 Tax=Planotetraspora thailandica TaxID=487172 RepID=A0A8J3V5P3_9ACTN|nr:DUF3043 domain-containing protein [Planotetraspora thailandica]GII55426.1 hypothetical protein Pth03_38150 [Planotetraspora thailandica]
MFRRRIQTPVDSPVPVTDPKLGTTPGKGRPTPKRSESQGRRRSPMTAPSNRKEAYRLQRDRDRADRTRAREGMLRGEERYLQPRDRGPARKFAREWVDSRRLPGQYFLPVMLGIMILSMLPFPVEVRSIVLAVYSVSVPLVLVLVIPSSLYTSNKVKKEAAAKFPDENLKGVGFYAAMRALQIRPLRYPKPTVRPGGIPIPPKN